MSGDVYLGIDASTRRRGVGLIDSSGLVASRVEPTQRGGGGQLILRIKSLLEDSGLRLKDLTGIGVTIGPGSFTALRVGASTAQGLGMGLGIPVAGVSSLEAAVYGAPQSQVPVAVLAPARNNEVFLQSFSYEPGIGWKSVSVIECLKVEELPGFIVPPILLTGPGVDACFDQIEGIFEGKVEPAPAGSRNIRPEDVAAIARERIERDPEGYPADKVEIQYLQSHGALTIQERREGKRS